MTARGVCVAELGATRIERAPGGGYLARLGDTIVARSVEPQSFAKLAWLEAPPEVRAQVALWWWPGGAPGALVEGAFPSSPRGWREAPRGAPDPRVRASGDGLELDLYVFEVLALRVHRARVVVRQGVVEFHAEELTRP